MPSDGLKITFGGKAVYQPGQMLEMMEYREYARVDRFSRQSVVEYCNRFLNPLGQRHCTGYLLMTKKDIDSLSRSATNTLKIEQPSPLPTLEFKNLLIVHGEAAFNATEDDDLIYAVEIADRRWFGSNEYYSVDFEDDSVQVFNLPAEMYPGEYYADSINGGIDPWTWQEVVTELWPTWLSSTAPTLPYTPDDEPVGFDFRGMGAYEAIGIVMDRLGCAISYVPSTGEYRIVRVGATSSLTNAEGYKIEQYKKYLEDELLYIDPTISLAPAGTVVNFHKLSNQPGSENTFPKNSGDQWLTDCIYSKRNDADEENLGEDATVMSGVYAQLWDDLPATVDFDGTVTNTTELATRALERHDNFYSQLHDADTIYRRVYFAGINFETSGLCRGVAWMQGDEGELLTETRCHPRMMLGVKGGQFEGISNTTRLRPPLLGPQLPSTYPYETAFVRIESGPDGDGLYMVTEVREDGSDLSEHDGIGALAVNANP